MKNATWNLRRSISKEPHWNLAFVGILAYMFIEYTRLPALYPVLQSLQLPKALVAFTAFGVLASARPRSGQRVSSHPIDFAMVAFLIACFGSTLFSEPFGLPGFINVLTWVVVYFLLSRALTSTWQLRVFVLVLLLLCLKLSQFEIRDYLSQAAFGRSASFLDQHGVGAGSTDFFGNGEDFGVAMCVVWPIAGALLFGEVKKLSKAFLAICFVSFLISIFLCGSRGAIVGAAAAAMTIWAKNPKRIVGFAMVVFFALGTFYVLPGAAGDRLRSALHPDQDETAQMRFKLWGAGMRMFESHPLFGVGVGNFAQVYWTEYSQAEGLSTPTVFVPHSIYVQALSETGLAGTIPLLAIWVFYVIVNARTRRQLKTLGLANRHNFEYRLSIGLDLAFVGFMVSGAFITVLYYPHLWYLLGLNVALHNTCMRKRPEAVPSETKMPLERLALATH